MYLCMFYLIKWSIPETHVLTIEMLIPAFIVGGLSIATTNGGIGIYPLSIALVLSSYGISKEIGLSFGWIVWSSQTILILILGALALFSNCHPLVGVLALFAAYQLIVRSSKATGTFAVDNVMPSEENKYEEMIEQNVIPQTLEEEVVKNMVPLVRDLPNGEQSYKPILDSNIDSSLL